MRTTRTVLPILLTAASAIASQHLAPVEHPAPAQHLAPVQDLPQDQSRRSAELRPVAELTKAGELTKPSYREIPLRANPGTAAITAVAENTPPFSLVGVSWPYRADSSKLNARIRVQRDGVWTDWERLPIEDEHAPGPGEGRPRSGTEPRWVGTATGVQASVVAADGTSVSDARVVLIQPGAYATDEGIEPGRSIAPTGQTPYPMPMMASRKRWRADESLRRYHGAACAKPKYTRTVLAAFVHHTADRNDYTRAQVPAMVRAIYAYHVRSRGWCDLGYNFLVDRFGRVFEGRYGGAQLPVLGAHTGSFNANSFGVALIGNYEKTAPSPAMLETTARVIAWKADAYYRPPKSTVVLAGSRLHTISGHRDTKATACPGNQLYGRLTWLRQRVDALTGGSVSTPIYRFARRIGLGRVGLPFWGEHRTKTGWATYFGTRDVFTSTATGTHSTVGMFRTRYRRLGTDRSRLGLPVTETYRVKVGLRQKFQGGWLIYHAKYRKVSVQLRGTA